MPGLELLKVDNLSVSYNLPTAKVLALRHINIVVKEGQIVVIAGETGSGKSTLGKIVLGLVDENACVDGKSSVYFEGKELTEFESLRGGKIGLIPQNPVLALNPVRRCGSQIMEVVKKFLPALTDGQRKDYILQLLADCELQSPSRTYSSYPHQLSLGQLQRVCIAMAIAPRPKLLVADEPFSSLDVLTKQTLVNIMLKLRESSGFAMLLITHDLGLIKGMSDFWYVLKDGVIKGAGDQDFLGHKHEDPYLKSLRENYLKLDTKSADNKDSSQPIIEARTLSYYYRKGGWLNKKHSHAALIKCNFEVYDGEIFGIVGRSGSGKSTLAKIIGGLQTEYEGSMYLGALEVRDMVGEDRKNYFRKVQYILQDAGSSLPPRLKMHEVLSLSIQAFYPGISKEDIADMQRELLRSVSLDPILLDRFRHQLSGGEQQRMCIARALCARPEVLILDESLTDLDQNVQEEVISLLRSLNKRQNLTIILVAHDLRLIRHCCHRLLVLNNGLVDSYGSWADVSSSATTEYLGELLAVM